MLSLYCISSAIPGVHNRLQTPEACMDALYTSGLCVHVWVPVFTLVFSYFHLIAIYAHERQMRKGFMMVNVRPANQHAEGAVRGLTSRSSGPVECNQLFCHNKHGCL